MCISKIGECFAKYVNAEYKNRYDIESAFILRDLRSIYLEYAGLIVYHYSLNCTSIVRLHVILDTA